MVVAVVKLLLFSLLYVKGEKQTCENSYKEIVSGDHKNGFQMIYNTGRDINDLGLYEDCLSLSNARYYLMVSKVKSNTVVLGICAPKTCTDKDLKALSKDMGNYYKGTTFGPYLQHATFKDSEKYNTRELSGSAFIFILGLVLYISLVIVSTYIEYIGIEIPKSGLSKKFEALTTFSLISNYKKFLQVPEHKSNTQCLDGIKVFSMLLISFSHMYVYYGSGPVTNLKSALNMVKSFKHRPVYIGIYSVDTFFMIGGFLLAYHSINSMNRGNMKWGLFFLHRFLRIMPVYLITTYFYIFVFPYLGFGPAWYLYEYSSKAGCDDYWWNNFVLLNNFLPTDEYSCMPWGWYIACDLQFFLLSPLLLILQYNKKIYGYGVCGVLILANFICLIIQGSVNDFVPGASGGLMNKEQFTEIYIKPYDRMAAYILGMVFGFLLRDYEKLSEAPKGQVEIELGSINNEDHPSKPLLRKSRSWQYKALSWVQVFKYRLASMIGGIFLILLMICLPYNYDKHGGDYWPKWFRVLFLASEHTGFTIGLVAFTIPLVFGFGGALNSLLSHSTFALASKLCLGFYLVHPMWIVFSCMNTPQGIYFEDVFIFFRYFGIVLLSVVSALAVYLLVEAPVMKMEKKLLEKLMR